MSHSNSSLNCFANCMMKYKHSYILHTEPDCPPSVHLTFGTMAHEVLYKAGKLRDESADGVLPVGEYFQVIPSEVLYPELKEAFNILNWENYFTQVIKQVAQYERECVKELIDTQSGPVEIDREIKLSITSNDMRERVHKQVITDEPLVGVIDLLIRTPKYAIILDYKFSSSTKTQDDFDMNSQLPVYALLVHHNYGIPLHNIKYGYIDIPKKAFDRPTVLTNGTLSRSKSQNVSQEMYKACVEAVHGDDPYYNCEPGNYYYDAWCNMANNKAAYLSCQWLDIDVFNGIIGDLFEAITMITKMRKDEMPFVKKYDSYSCKSCEYLSSCKPWLGVNN